jgi:hypothetical protein
MQWRRRVEWRPRDLDWRVAALFMIGSFAFALGSFPPYSQHVDPAAVGLTFFVGSIFFTTASYSQFLQTINGGEAGDGTSTRFRFWSWQPRAILWWATVVQLAGTIYFNVTTFRALQTGLDAQQTNRLVWGPDFKGSICFLVASHLAWLAVCHRVWCVRRDDSDWWVAALNYAGSICFMASAIAQFTLPTTGEELNTTIVNAGTFLGAVCFFVGAYLLLPPRRVLASVAG